MCRHLCYLGPPITLASLVFQAPHSLAVQAYAPQDMRSGGSVNADGFGVGWYGPHGLTRYRRPIPIWQDPSFAALAAHTTAEVFLAAVRNATEGLPVTEAAAAPFAGGGWLFSLNGRMDGWPSSAVKLAETLSTEELLTLDAPTDAALLWAVVRARLAEGGRPAEVLAQLVADVLAAAPNSRLNLLLTDGGTAWATTVTHALWARLGPSVLASEPLDADSAWQPIPDGSLVRLDRHELTVEPLNV